MSQDLILKDFSAFHFLYVRQIYLWRLYTFGLKPVTHLTLTKLMVQCVDSALFFATQFPSFVDCVSQNYQIQNTKMWNSKIQNTKMLSLVCFTFQFDPVVSLSKIQPTQPLRPLRRDLSDPWTEIWPEMSFETDTDRKYSAKFPMKWCTEFPKNHP